MAIILGEKTEWTDLKKMLTNSNFFLRVINFDKENSLKSKTIKRLRAHLVANPVVNNLDDMESKGSKAARQLAEWVLAMRDFS